MLFSHYIPPTTTFLLLEPTKGIKNRQTGLRSSLEDQKKPEVPQIAVEAGDDGEWGS